MGYTESTVEVAKEWGKGMLASYRILEEKKGFNFFI